MNKMMKYYAFIWLTMFFIRAVCYSRKHNSLHNTIIVNNYELTKSTAIYAKSKPSTDDDIGSEMVRLNKCLTTLSRRAADQAIFENRVTINNNVAKIGDKVKRGDIVRLDGTIQKWFDLARAKEKVMTHSDMEKRNFIYLKYWKPVGR
jgi:ribosomal 50S subunit-recycling heat shock protein